MKFNKKQLKQPIKLFTKFFGPSKSEKYYTQIPSSFFWGGEKTHRYLVEVDVLTNEPSR